VLTTLRELLEDGHAEVVVALAEQAIDCAEDALGFLDDSDGYMSGIAEDLQGLHLDACLSARPDPVTLATTLFERELHSGDLDVFHGAAASYTEVLGKPGLTEYRRRAQIIWDALPSLGPGDKGSFDSRRFQITSMMRTLAEVAGDVDAAVDVLARDQSSPYQFVLIAERLRDAGRYDDALAWAEKGLELFACEDSRLVETATQEYHRAGRGADAVALAWRAYDERTNPAGYQRLREQARLAGVWEDSRERALSKLRAQVDTDVAAASRKKTGQPQPWAVCDASALASVFLFEGDVDQAWSEAQAAGCSRVLWLELARLRAQDHPSEAIPIWQSDVERAIDAKNNHAYAEAVATIARIRTLMVEAGQDEAFPSYTEQLRARHKAKRNLMKLFDQHHW
jgi:tetratricopeptide (TPR) repeat protein